LRTLETERLTIRAFALAEAETYARLLDAAFGRGAYGSSEDKRVMFEYQVAADAGLALLHQPPYGDRATPIPRGSRRSGSSTTGKRGRATAYRRREGLGRPRRAVPAARARRPGAAR